MPDDINRSTPPSPAPATPLRHREKSFHEEPLYTRGRIHNYKEYGPWSYEDHEGLAHGRPSRHYSGPRTVQFKGLGDGNSDDEAVGLKYRINEFFPTVAGSKSPTQTFRSSYYGADCASQPFKSFLGPKHTVQRSSYQYQESSSYAKQIYEAYHSDQQDYSNHMGSMNPLEDHDRKIIIEFCHLLEKSKQLFNGLRELPQYGHKQWSLYFGRTFDIYTRLWKYQQQHRAVLDSKYGMKRWQIGEIASKIGQLYYHF